MINKQNTLVGIFCIITFLMGLIVGDISGTDQGNQNENSSDLDKILTLNEKILKQIAVYNKLSETEFDIDLVNELAILSNRVDDLNSLLVESKDINGNEKIAIKANSNVECLSHKKIEELVSVVIEQSSNNTLSNAVNHQPTLSEERIIEIDKFYDRGNSILSSASTSGTWTDENRENFNLIIRNLPGDKQTELLQAFSRKINNGEIKVDSIGLPFGFE